MIDQNNYRVKRSFFYESDIILIGYFMNNIYLDLLSKFYKGGFRNDKMYKVLIMK